ncbi:MAG: hypothetical protein ABIE47_05945 [Pseudomonadota bacterium]
MKRPAVLRLLCALATEVGERKFKHELEHDCFCGDGYKAKGFQFHPEIVAYIVNAVQTRLKEEGL